MKRYIKLYYQFVKYNLTKAMMYRADFIIWSLVTIGWIIFTLIFYQLLFTQINNIAGWSKPQMLILQGFYFLTDVIFWGIFYENLYQIPIKINSGELDLELTKPINKQFLLSTKIININQINSVFLGIATIIYALKLGNIHPTIGQVFFSISIFLLASIFMYSGWFITVCTAFWFERLENIIYFFPSFRELAKIPLPAYQGAIKLILTYVIPITLVTTLPSQFLLGDPDFHLVVILAIISFSSLLISHWFLKISLKRYSGASS